MSGLFQANSGKKKILKNFNSGRKHRFLVLLQCFKTDWIYSANKAEGKRMMLGKDKSTLKSVIIMKYDPPLKLCREI